MNCDHCDKPAVVHEVMIRNGVKKEVHLCDEHAASAGYSVPSQSLDQLLTKFVVAQGKKETAVRKVGECSECGMSFQRFRQTGTLGCPACYEAFEKYLKPVIQRAQAGANSHVGRAPARAGKSVDRQLLRRRLVQELDQAVSTEAYERAAVLRDQLLSLDEMSCPAEAGGEAETDIDARSLSDVRDKAEKE